MGVCWRVHFGVSVCDVRELAYQIADQFRVFGSHIGLRDVVIVGGTGKLSIYSYIVLPVGDWSMRGTAMS